MYVPRDRLSDTRDLNQGDVLGGIYRPLPPSEKNFVLLRNKNKAEWPAPTRALAESDKELRVVVEPRRDACLVVSNSCDNARATLPILLVPIFPFKLKGQNAEEQWREVSEAATGTAYAKTFYLPSSQEYGFERGQAQFNFMFPVSHDYIRRCVDEAKATRVCGLTPEAQGHLKWALALFFGRNSREDYDWPSLEDLDLKRQWLEARLSRPGPGHERFKADLEEVQKRLAIIKATLKAAPAAAAAIEEK